MRNLLWKFVALSGVTGLGLLVVWQAMQGLAAPLGNAESTAREINPSPVFHPDETHQHRPPIPDPLPGLARPEPLKTTETVALTEPLSAWPERPSSPPGRETAVQPVQEPLPVASETGSNVPPVNLLPAPPVESQEFPAFPPEALPPARTAAVSLPALPVLQPVMVGSEEREPNEAAFSDPLDTLPASPFRDPPALSGEPETTPTPAANPFDTPKPTEQEPTAATGPTRVPFDPYEPELEPELKPSPAQDNPNSEAVPFAEPPLTQEAPETVAAPAELPSEPETEIKSEPAPTRKPTERIPADASPSKPNAGDPRLGGFALPGEPSPQALQFPAVKPEPTLDVPGRASVMIPLAPPAEGPLTFPAPPPARFEPHVPPLALPLASGPKCAVPGQTLTPVVAQLDPPPEPPPGDAAGEFADPLDQLNYSNATPLPAPASAPVKPQPQPVQPTLPSSGPESKPESKSLPPEINPGPGAAPLIRPRPIPAEAFPVPVLGSAVEPPGENPAMPRPPETKPGDQSPATSEELNGVGTLNAATPSGPQRPELTIEKTAPPKAALGQPMIYNIVVKNVGTSAAHEVVVEDQVPKGTRLTGTIPRGEMTDQRLIWRLGSIPPGEEQKIAVRVIPTEEGSVGSVAKVSFVAEVASRTVVAAAKLTLELSGPKEAMLGTPVSYHFKIGNAGSGDASEVYLRNVLPDGLKHPDGNDLEYEVGTLKAGETKDIDLTLTTAQAGQFITKASLTGRGGLTAEAVSPLKIIGERLTITRTGPKRRYVGRRAAFSNTLTNQSDTMIASARVVEKLPNGMDFVDADPGAIYNPEDRSVSWEIAQLGPRENRLLKLELLARTEGAQASTVTAYDPNGTKAEVTSETTVEGYTALRLDVREHDDPVDVGEQVGLRVVATNRGTSETTNVVVKVTLPAEMEFISAQGPVDFKRDGATLTFNPVASVKGRTEMEFDLVLKSVKPGDARVRLEISSDQTPTPLARDEAVRILAKRP